MMTAPHVLNVTAKMLRQAMPSTQLKLAGYKAGYRDGVLRAAEMLRTLSQEMRACPDCGADEVTNHTGSTRCQSGSIASGGAVAHCTCDTCF